MEKRVQQYVDKHKLAVKVVRIGKFGEDELDSSSKIRQKILEKFAR
jgi:glycerol-3-phosphate cytidylyltransferase-like family protein